MHRAGGSINFEQAFLSSTAHGTCIHKFPCVTEKKPSNRKQAFLCSIYLRTLKYIYLCCEMVHAMLTYTTSIAKSENTVEVSENMTVGDQHTRLTSEMD